MPWKKQWEVEAYETKLESDLASTGDQYLVDHAVEEFVRLRNDPEVVNPWAYAGNPPESCDRMAGWDAVEKVMKVPAWATAESGKVRGMLMPYVDRVVAAAAEHAPFYYNPDQYTKGKADRDAALAAYEATEQAKELGPTDADFNAMAARVKAKQDERHGKEAE